MTRRICAEAGYKDCKLPFFKLRPFCFMYRLSETIPHCAVRILYRVTVFTSIPNARETSARRIICVYAVACITGKTCLPVFPPAAKISIPPAAASRARIARVSRKSPLLSNFTSDAAIISLVRVLVLLQRDFPSLILAAARHFCSSDCSFAVLLEDIVY
jgi:hypothetical protein